MISTQYSTGRNYNGDGVNVVMQDDGYVQPHIDRQGRVDESFCNGCSTSSGKRLLIVTLEMIIAPAFKFHADVTGSSRHRSSSTAWGTRAFV